MHLAPSPRLNAVFGIESHVEFSRVRLGRVDSALLGKLLMASRAGRTMPLSQASVANLEAASVPLEHIGSGWRIADGTAIREVPFDDL